MRIFATIFMLSALLLLQVFSTSAQDKAERPVTIIHQDFEKAKQAAADEHKILFIDFYTTWCGPCKIMSKAMFDNEKNATKLNKRFVVLKYDAEKDQEHNLTKKYHVNAYPTAVFLNEDGQVIDKKFGIKMGDDGMDVANYWLFLDKIMYKYEHNEHIGGVSAEINLDYPRFYADRINCLDRDYEGLASEYWKNLTKAEYEKEVTFAVLAYFGGNDEVNEYFLSHLPRYTKLFGETDVHNVTSSIITGRFYEAIRKEDDAAFARCSTEAARYLPAGDAEYMTNYFAMKLWKARGQWDKIIAYATENKAALTEDGQMNAICWDIFENCDDKKVVKQAALLMKAYNDEKPSWATVDTYANLLYKAGNTDAAIAEMERAIALGNEEGQDVSESEAALKKFKGEN